MRQPERDELSIVLDHPEPGAVSGQCWTRFYTYLITSIWVCEVCVWKQKMTIKI